MRVGNKLPSTACSILSTENVPINVLSQNVQEHFLELERDSSIGGARGDFLKIVPSPCPIREIKQNKKQNKKYIFLYKVLKTDIKLLDISPLKMSFPLLP